MTNALTGRLNFRLDGDQERALRQAAALTGQSVSGFVLSAAVVQAHEVLDRSNQVEVSAAAFKRFVADLEAPAELVPELVELLHRDTRIPSS